jgi:HSP20 family molecular chaperone IbpA
MKKNPLNLDPKEELQYMRSMVERRFSPGPPPASDDAIPIAVDASERDGIVTIKAALPGIASEQIDVHIAPTSLTIRSREHCPCGHFARTVRLPGNLATECAKTRIKNGFVCVRIPKCTSRHASA